MTALRRITPIDLEEIDRTVDRLESVSSKIQDRDSFDLEFSILLNTVDLSPQQKGFQQRVFDKWKRSHPETSPERLFTRGGGKDLKRDREIDAKVIVTSEDEFVKKRSKNVDLKGFDTRKQKIDKRRKRLSSQTELGAIRGKTVFVTSEVIKIKGRTVQIFRDSKGRFASKKRR